MKIRHADESDAEAIAVLAAQLGYPNQATQIRERLTILSTQQNSDIFVCETGQRVLGWVQVAGVLHLMSPPFAEIGGLVVEVDHRGQGIGSALLDQAETWAKERGLTSVWIRSNIIRVQAHEFYLGQGYHLIKSQQVFRKELVNEDPHESDGSG